MISSLLTKSFLFCLIGRGVRTTIKRSRGDFLLTYHGELVTEAEGERREEVVPSVFRYFFQQKKKGWW